MMDNSRKITVKDVALKCNVSVSLAAAVLSNSKNNIGCSDVKRARIMKVAEELDYHSNKLARAMKTGIVPLVAMCIHHTQPEDDLNLYLHDLLPSVTTALKLKGFNTILISYDTAEDMMTQTQALVGGNLISGIITNFPPEHCVKIADYLKRINLPYVMLGCVKDEAIPCVCDDSTALIAKLTEYAEVHGLKRAVKMLAVKNVKGETEWEPLPVLFPSSNEKYDVSALNLQDRDTLWVAFGEFTRRLLVQQGINEKNIISIENKWVLVQFKPTVFVRSKVAATANQAAELLTSWIATGRIEEPRQRVVKVLPEDIELII
ncbi:MAG: LacI family DNA-binding transcriptional regulator [Victivallaceae bacterium]|jgi:DNA-binding LacI/PurR family transcriptional regulator